MTDALHHKRVLVSLLTWDAHDYVKNLLDNLQKTSIGSCDYRIRILDQGSQEDTQALVRQFQATDQRVSAVFLEQNVGFSVGHNKNFDDVWKEWQFDYFVALNSDVVFDEAQWLDKLVWVMENRPNTGIAGPHVLNHIDSPEHLRGHGRPASQEEIVNGRFTHVSGCVAIIRSSVVFELGLFDASFTPGYFEDADLSRRYSYFDYDLGYIPIQFRHHYLGQERSTAKSKHAELCETFGDYQERNRQLFVGRWMDGPEQSLDKQRLWETFPNIYFPPQSPNSLIVVDGPVAGDHNGFSFDIGPGSRLIIDQSAQIRRYAHFEIYDGGIVTVGPRVVIGMYNWIQGNGGLEIGEDTIIGPHACLLSSMHNIDKDSPVRNQPLKKKYTVIGKDVFIGAHVTVAAGVTLSDGCVIGSNSYVDKDVAPYQIAGGVPARFIGERKSKADRIKAMAVVAVGNTDRPDRFNTHTSMYVAMGNALSDRGIDSYYVCHPESSGNLAAVPSQHKFFLEDHSGFESLLDDIQPDLIYIWNGASDGDLITRKFAAERNIPIVYSELGWFPQGETVYFDPEGTNARSSIRNLDLTNVNIDVQLDDWIEHYLNRQTPQRNGTDGFVFVPLQDEHDINITQDSPYRTMDAFVGALSRAFPDQQFIVRPHPRYRDVKISDYPNVSVREDGQLYEWMASAKAVVGINSTVLLESLLFGRPTHSLGTGLATGLNVFFEATRAEDIDLEQDIDPERHLRIRKLLSELIFRRQVRRSGLSDPDYLLNGTILGDIFENVRANKRGSVSRC